MTLDLLWPALAIGVVSFWLVRRKLPLPVAAFVVSIKFLIPAVYFGWFYNGTWTFLDDVIYQMQGQVLLQERYDPFTIFFNPTGVRRLMDLSQGYHILYGWWNLLAQYLFGPHYYAPIFLNVGLTFVAGRCLFEMAQIAGFSRSYAQGLLVFFLLYWDVLTWSSLVNVKEVPVMTLIVITLYFFGRFDQKMRWRYMVGAGVALFALWWIRFYVAGQLIAAGLLWFALKSFRFNRLRPGPLMLITGLFLIVIGVVRTQVLALIGWASQFIVVSSLPYGLVHFWLTPQPWSLSPEYTFLLLPSMLHWIFLGPALMGAVLLWRRSSLGRLTLIFLGLVIILYAVSPEAQGPRQRVEITFVLAWMQFHLLWVLTQGAVRRRLAQPAASQPI